MKIFLAVLSCVAAYGASPLFLTETNSAANYLVVINANTKEVDYVPTGGAGGVAGGSNAGGVAVSGKMAAAINFGSSNVTIFVRQGNAMQPTQLIKTASQPVSVTFAQNHLLVLEATMAESFPVYGTTVTASADGTVPLQIGDGSAAQIVGYGAGAAYTEKSGSIVELNLSTEGAPGLSGPGVSIALPSFPNNNTPFGLIGRGANLYVTIAHSDLETLVVGGRIVASASGQTPYLNGTGGFLHAPCWNALSGQFLYSTDSPAHEVVRFLVSDTNVFFDKPVATTAGTGWDLAIAGSLMGVIDGGNGTVSNASLFTIDSEGELTLNFSVPIRGVILGAAIIQ